MRGVVTKLPQIRKEIYGYLLALKSRKLSIKIWQVGCLLSIQHNNNPTLELIWKPQNEWIHLVFCLFFSPTMLWLISFNFVGRYRKKNHSWNAKVEDEKWCGAAAHCWSVNAHFVSTVSTCCFNTRKRMTFYKLGKTSFASSSSSSCLFKVIITRY